jgi:uncharacterized protein YndB with AHSA1/START domain
MEMNTRMTNRSSSARAVADEEQGTILAAVELGAPPDAVFRMLASDKVTDWWVRPGVFDTREWAGDVRAGGTWRASGVGGGRPYQLEGEFVEVDAPRKLTHTWRSAGAPTVTMVAYRLKPIAGGTALTLRHSGFTSPDSCTATCIGWETSFERLEEILVRAVT